MARAGTTAGCACAGGALDVGAERGVGEVDGRVHGQVGAGALKHGRRLHDEVHQQVAGAAALHALGRRVALAAHAHRHAAVHACAPTARAFPRGLYTVLHSTASARRNRACALKALYKRDTQKEIDL